MSRETYFELSTFLHNKAMNFYIMTRLCANYTIISIEKTPRGHPRVNSVEKLREMNRIIEEEGIEARAMI